MTDSADRRTRPFSLIALILSLSLALPLGLFRCRDSGPLWPDSPRYTNAGAMILDWLHSGQLLTPLSFAQGNYAQYPGFSIPYHPAGYPALLCVWFGVFGTSYESARVFIALNWALTGWFFSLLARRLGLRPYPALGGMALLLTTPQLVIWARDTMSEIPSLAAIMSASFFWVRWLQEGRRIDGLVAAALGLLAFHCRVTTAGVLPGLLLFGWWSGLLNRRRILWVVLYCLLYMVANAGYVKFAEPLASDEVTSDGRTRPSFAAAYRYFEECLPGILASGTAALGILGLGLALGRRSNLASRFWLSWFASYFVFKCAVVTTPQVRHYATALPALAGLSCLVFTTERRWATHLAIVAFVAALAVNLGSMTRIPKGLIGYEAVGDALARIDRPGNILMACWEDQDLIFRFRSAEPQRRRYCFRSDRTLAIRTSAYSGRAARMLASKTQDVLDLLQRGRVGYVITCAPDPGSRDTRTEEMKLTEATIRENPERFRSIAHFPVSAEYAYGANRGVHGVVTVWEVAGPVEEGPPQLQIVIPTAGIEYNP